LKKDVFNNASRIEYGKDHNVAAIASYVIKKDQPNLMTIHFFSVDHYQHEQGRQGDKVSAAVADADSSVGIIIDALKEAGIWEKTVLIVTGDHGFLDVKTSVNPNVWLTKAGLITDVKKDDWKAQFFSVGGSSYLYLKDKNDSKTLKQVNDILANLPAEDKKLFRIIDRKLLDKVGGNPDVAFALSGENGASFGNAMTGDAIKAGKGGTHGYYPDFREIRTGFVACGPGINAGGVIPEMNLRDIAPALAKLLGLSLPTAEGKIPTELLSK
jgi:predicted AlkP superfamily pyrophosphatase or phosphodiesterase